MWGSASKRLFVFTHFDEVKGDSQPNAVAALPSATAAGAVR